MRVSDFTRDMYRKYYDLRLNGRITRSGVQFTAKCPFHDDQHASLSLNLEKGVWRCHGPCKQGGGVIDFERKFLGGTEQDAIARVAELMGEPQGHFNTHPPEVIYVYHDASGKPLFEKLRYPNKQFSLRQVVEGGYEGKLRPGPRPLYHLPLVLRATEIMVAEGEKDCDNLLQAFPGHNVAATTNFDGAGHWLDRYSTYFMGKKAVIFADNDEPGDRHAEMVARSLFRYATEGVKLVRFPELPAKGDVSDYLASHTPVELIERVKSTPTWKPSESDQAYFIYAGGMLATAPKKIDWLVQGLIQRHSNGMITSQPKAGKSFTMIDLALALATGQPWLGMAVPNPVRVGFVSREDNQESTAWRMARLAEGRGIRLPVNFTPEAPCLWFNTRMTSRSLALDNTADLQELMRQVETHNLELLILDVFRVLHAQQENDNSAMQSVLASVSQIQEKTGAQVLLVHHENKSADGTLTERARGASAIAGWAEYMMGLSVIVDETRYLVRQMEFEIKQGNRPKSIYYQIVDMHSRECSNYDDCECSRLLEVRQAAEESE